MAQILVVDDEKNYRETLCALLRDQGFQPVPAGSGEEAVNVLISETIDLVLTDSQMETMTGLDLIRKMKEREIVKHIPVILLTGNPDPEVLRVAKMIGAFQTLVKPFDFEELVATIKQALRSGSDTTQGNATEI